VVAIVVGAIALTSHGGPRGSSSPVGAALASPSVAGAPAPPGPGSYVMKGTTVVSAIVPVKLTVSGKTTWSFVWFSHRNSGSDRSLQLCVVTEGGGFDGSGGCDPATASPQELAAGGVDGITQLASDPQVTSLLAQLPHGRSVAGVGVWGRGFPDRVWLTVLPQLDNATLLLRNADGQVVKRVSVAAQYPIPARPSSGGITLFSYPAGTIAAKAGTLTAYLLPGSRFGVSGKVVGFFGSGGYSATGSDPVNGPEVAVDMGGGWQTGAKVVEQYGYTHANVARVALRAPDGKQYGAETTAAWPGSGVRLWHFTMPIAAMPIAAGKLVMLGYDAAGHVVWQKPLSESQ